MPEPWEKVLKSTELPNPELNPLYNATLGRNLGRWAHVYFTTPPEKRDEAVTELLRELERDEHGGKVKPKPIANTSVREVAPVEEELVCPACGALNKPGQRFCGICGGNFSQARKPIPPANRVEQLPQQSPQSAPSDETVPVTQSAPADTEWIRERTLTRFTVEEPKSGTGWGKYAAVGVLMLLAAFGGLEWISRRPVQVQQVVASPAGSGTSDSAATAQPPASPAQAQTPEQRTRRESKPKANEPPPEPAREARQDDVKPAEPPRKPIEEAVERKSSRTVAPEPPMPPSSEEMSGTQELAMAQHFLGSKGGSRDTSEAAKWLWKSVAKQNTTATVLLADLYARGDGVSRSCDQARLLLDAAAKKGNSAAGEKLRHLETGGCK